MFEFQTLIQSLYNERTQDVRNFSNWLDGLLELTTETESPEHFWYWSGISTIAGALQRKVHLPWGFKSLFPNLYIILVAPPGHARKGNPLQVAKDFLDDLGVRLSADSTTRRGFIRDLEESITITGYIPGEPLESSMMRHSSLTVISEELSSLLGIDLKLMIEHLTDLFDISRDKWEYRLANEKDSVPFPFVNILAGTTPSWLSSNLPQSAFGDGFTSRVAFIVGYNKPKLVPRPGITEAQERKKKLLLKDLREIHKLQGKFTWGEGAGELNDKWYIEKEDLLVQIADERVHAFISRIQVVMIKTAMCISAAKGNSLILERSYVEEAIGRVMDLVPTLSDAFGSSGRSQSSENVHALMTQIETLKTTSVEELQSKNWRNMDRMELQRALETLRAMRRIEYFTDQNGEGRIKWTRNT